MGPGNAELHAHGHDHVGGKMSRRKSRGKDPTTTKFCLGVGLKPTCSLALDGRIPFSSSPCKSALAIPKDIPLVQRGRPCD